MEVPVCRKEVAALQGEGALVVGAHPPPSGLDDGDARDEVSGLERTEPMHSALADYELSWSRVP